MRVALVHDYLREYGGAERVLEALHELFPDAPIYTAYYFPEKMPEQFKSMNVRTSVMQKWWGIRSKFLWYTYLVPWALEQCDLREYDVIISSSSFAAKGVLTSPEQIHVDYCHTPTRFVWGINRSSNRSFIHALLAPLDALLRQWDFAAAQRVDYFIANSEVVKTRIKRFYKRDAEVIYPPLTVLVPTEIAPVEDYFLVVSRLESLKNVEKVVLAFNELGLPLKIAGTGSQKAYLQSIAKPHITFLGYVSDEERSLLYAHCKALVAAMENDDFGMTLPEVQAYGRPVIALRSGGHVESVIEGTTGIFFDAIDVPSIIAAVKDFEHRSFDSSAIQAHAKQFSSEVFASKITSFIEKVSLPSEK